MDDRPEPTARCSNREERQAQVCPYRAGGYGFLKHRFEPLTGNDNLHYSRKEEAELLAFFENLGESYGYRPLEVFDKPYPYNIYLLNRQAKEVIAKTTHRGGYTEVMLMEEKCKLRFVTTTVATTGTTLYYISVRPLWMLMQKGTHKKEVELLLSLFAYLHQIVGIPFFDDWSYIGSQYQMVKEWMSEDEGWLDEEEYQTCLSQVNMALHFGERLYRQVKHPYHLKKWESRIESYKATDEQSTFLNQVVQEAYRLYTDHPQRSIMDNIHEGLLEPQEEMRIRMEQLFAFVWSVNGWLGDRLFETVNMELNECGVMDEPLVLGYGDNASNTDQLDFEYRLYKLLHMLSELLNNIGITSTIPSYNKQ